MCATTVTLSINVNAISPLFPSIPQFGKFSNAVYQQLQTMELLDLESISINNATSTLYASDA
jgi:hypothetical protein